MNIPINYWAVIVASVANLALGMIWFGTLFGKEWAKYSETNTNERKFYNGSTNIMSVEYFFTFVGSLVMATVMSYYIITSNAFLQTEGISTGFMAGLIAWLGFVAPVTIGVVLWDNKPWMYWLITYGYYLIAMLVMGSILASWL